MFNNFFVLSLILKRARCNYVIPLNYYQKAVLLYLYIIFQGLKRGDLPTLSPPLPTSLLAPVRNGSINGVDYYMDAAPHINGSYSHPVVSSQLIAWTVPNVAIVCLGPYFEIHLYFNETNRRSQISL